MNKFIVTAAIAALTMSAPAMAQKNPGWYGGLGVGWTTIEAEGAKDRATGLGLYGGYQVNQYFAWEGELQWSGDAKDQIGNTSFEGSYNNFGVGIVGMYPIGDIVSVFGRFTAIYGKGEFTTQQQGFAADTQTARDGGYSVGIGAGTQFGPVDLRLRYDYLRVTFSDIGGDFDKPTRIGLDVLWRFGDSK